MTKEERGKAQEAFLKAMENTANVRAACMHAGIHPSTVYQWAEHDLQFSIRFKEANTQANWLLFGEAWHRAVQGEERYYISRGEVVRGPDGNPVTYREKSDRLLELLLKARLPEFREKQHIEMNANVSGSVKSDLSDELRLLSKEQLAQFKAWLVEAKAQQEP
jgi:hypothetical protein